MRASEILSKAADLIEPEGAWAKGWYAFVTDSEGRHECESLEDYERANCWCPAGAINNVSRFSDSDRALAKYALISVIDDNSHAVMADEIIANWNDAEDRTQSEVVSALRKASQLAAEQEAA